MTGSANRRDPRLRRRQFLGAALAALGVSASSAAWAEPRYAPLTPAREAFGGVWRIETPSTALTDSAGGTPPLLPEAREAYQANQALLRAGDLHFDPTTWCSSPGMPRLMLIDYPFELIVRPDVVAFRHEWNRWFRLVDMSGVDLEVIVPGATGVAMGGWEGDTLVIRTKGLVGTSLLDGFGMPHSEALTLTERLRLVDAETLEDRITFDDPQTFSQRWETIVTYRRQPAGTRIAEDVCLDRIGAGLPAIRR